MRNEDGALDVRAAARRDGAQVRCLFAPGFAAMTAYLAPGVFVVSLEGEFDLATAPALREQLLEILSDSSSDVVVDLSNVTLVDSSTLGVLFRALRALRAEDRSFSLVARDERILKTFRITALDRVFEVYDSLDEASRPHHSLPRARAASGAA